MIYNKIVTTAILLATFYSCTKITEQENLEIIGHAGSGLSTHKDLYASNSKESIEYALGRYGVNGVEMDLQLSADGKIFLYHDDDLSSQTTMSGCINNHHSDDFLNENYKSFNKEKIAKLADLNFAYFENKSVYLDVRHNNFCNNSVIDRDFFISSLAQEIVKFPVSTRKNAVVRFNEWAPGLDSMGIDVYIEPENIEDFKALLLQYPMVVGMMIRNNNITKKQIEEIHALGKKVIIFELRSSKSTKEAFNKGPDGILVDDLLSALALKR